MPREFANRYLNPGDERRTNVPVIASTRQNNDISNLYVAYSAYNYSDVRVAKGDFIRMKEISLSYDFPQIGHFEIAHERIVAQIPGNQPVFDLFGTKSCKARIPTFSIREVLQYRCPNNSR